MDSDQTYPAHAAPGIVVSYWYGELPFNGADEFRHQLESEYSKVEVRGAQGGLGGGLYTLFVEISAAITLSHLLKLILDGVAFDLIKLGAEKLILRPLLAAQRKLRERNKANHEAGEIASLRIAFIDSVVTIDADSRVYQSISDSVGTLLPLLAENYERLALADGTRPVEIYIPVIEDTGADRRSRFRAVLEVDEEMQVSDRVFFEYWGLAYYNGSRRVFDVKRQLLLDEYFLYRSEYWDQMRELWQQRGLL